MADTQTDKQIEESDRSPSISAFLPTSSAKHKLPNVDENFELCWPVADERDSTQILKEDPTPNAIQPRDGQGSSRESAIDNYNKIKKAHQKKAFGEDDKILFQKIDQPSLNNEGTNKKEKMIGCLAMIKADQDQATSKSHQTDYFKGLSDEVILAVFSFLTKKNVIACTKVCKRWRRLASDETLWHSLDLTGSTFSENVLRRLLMRGVVVFRAAWAEVVSSRNDEFLGLSEGASLLKEKSDQDTCYNLQYLDASSCKIKEDIFLQSISKCRNLKNLSLESFPVSTSLLRAIGTCRHLSVLNLCMCRNITKAGLCVLSKGCPRITELNLSWTNLTQECIGQVVRSFPMLIKVNLSGCRETLHDQAVGELLAACSNLRCLDLSDCIVITEFCVKAIVQHGQIEELSLSRCYGVAPKSLELLSSLKSLKTLQIFGFLTTAGIAVLKKALRCVNINGSMFSTIARPTGTLYKKRIWGMKCKGLED